MASITPYKDGWRAQIAIKGVRDSRTFRTQREARAWAASREHEIRLQSTQSPGERYTVRDMLERYEREVSSTKKGARSESLRIASLLKNFPDFAALKLADVRTPDLAAWRDARLRDVSPASVNRDINWLRNAFSVARKEWHWMEGNPWEGFRLPVDGPPRDRRVTSLEVKLICRQLGYRTGVAPVTLSQETALAFLVALRTAMRAGEVLSLGAGNLDLTKRVARVNHKMQHLTGRPREVPLTRHAARLLRPVAARDRCFTVTSASMEALFRKARGRLAALYPDIAGLHFHDTRAEALTRLARRVDVMTLAKISGHMDLRTLQNTYYRESAADIAARI
ncbi:tyrosine-type recombinase/integrase [Paraburkholderia sp. BR10936]|uniref:tyrosine-type recombinase/integrase n=1 Tax=Paraburkholderia sp. BR10936 TaxID=3236993 RepID=UPI0034D24E53